MKGGSDRTKVVLRHLPPTITESTLIEQIDSAFGSRYHWLSFRPGKNSLKHPQYSRAYIDFKMPDDVLEFAEFFNGHVFVNEKGTQFKTIVEYAPSQRVPKQWSKKDGREGTIHKDPEYMEFLELISKPVENLPSAEIQLERREAERAGAAKEYPIVTALMGFVRQKRAAKIGSRRILSNGKLSRRNGGLPAGSSSAASSKRGPEKKKGSTMYVLRDTAKSITVKEKSNSTPVSRRDDQLVSDKSVTGADALEDESGGPGNANLVKKKVLLLKGKEKEILHQQNVPAPVRNLFGSTAVKNNQRRETTGKIVRGILTNKDIRPTHSGGVHPEHPSPITLLEKDRRPPRPSNPQFYAKDMNGATDEKAAGDNMHGFYGEKRTRNKDRPERVVWTPLRRSDGSHASDESLSSSVSQPTHITADSFEGSSKQVGRRGTPNFVKDVDGALLIGDGKGSRKSTAAGYGSHEKQVWVQKSGSGS